MNDLWAAIFYFSLGFIGYLWGFANGKRSRKIDLSECSDDVRSAIAGFFQHEIQRHLDDIERTQADLRKLMYQGVKVPKYFPIGYWWRV